MAILDHYIQATIKRLKILKIYYQHFPEKEQEIGILLVAI
jgi:hypothetical protein